jgi:hypothetical protein
LYSLFLYKFNYNNNKTMKNLFLSILAITSITFTSCSEDDETKKVDDPINPNLVSLDPANFKGELLSGKEAVLDPTKVYLLTGKFVVQNGAKLTIPAGTVIKATVPEAAVPGGPAVEVRYIAVAQGGQIFINGTATNPVIMTSNAPTPAKSNWGGLVICGKAPINNTSVGGTASAEVSELTYGGTVTNDNSGVIKYLRIEYTGFAYNSSKEFNGLTLFGVGSGTTVEYVHANHNGDDGIEFFGGTVNGKWLVSTDSDDDAIDFADGWAGTGQFWYIKDTAKAGIEGSNNGTNGLATPLTNATLKDISIVKGTLINSEHAIFIKEGGGKWNASNIFIDGAFAKGIKVNATDAPSIASITDGFITFNPILFPTSSGFINSEYAGTNTSYLTIGTNTGAGSGATAPSWTTGWTTGL